MSNILSSLPRLFRALLSSSQTSLEIPSEMTVFFQNHINPVSSSTVLTSQGVPVAVLVSIKQYETIKKTISISEKIHNEISGALYSFSKVLTGNLVLTACGIFLTVSGVFWMTTAYQEREEALSDQKKEKTDSEKPKSLFYHLLPSGTLTLIGIGSLISSMVFTQITSNHLVKLANKL